MQGDNNESILSIQTDIRYYITVSMTVENNNTRWHEHAIFLNTDIVRTLTAILNVR